MEELLEEQLCPPGDGATGLHWWLRLGCRAVAMDGTEQARERDERREQGPRRPLDFGLLGRGEG